MTNTAIDARQAHAQQRGFCWQSAPLRAPEPLPATANPRPPCDPTARRNPAGDPLLRSCRFGQIHFILRLENDHVSVQLP